jgi:hypothetical protein
MAKIQNYEVCVNADELSNAEILLTTALLIRGYYCSASRVYISFIGSNMKETAVATVSNACTELGIPFTTLDSDSCPDRYYLWGNKLSEVLAKQRLVPDKNQKWRNKLKIPTSWHQLPNDRRQIINNLIFGIVKTYDTKISGLALRLPDNNALAKGLIQLLAPINQNIQIRYGGSAGRKPLLWNVRYMAHLNVGDDISDLL